MYTSPPMENGAASSPRKIPVRIPRARPINIFVVNDITGVSFP